MTDHTDPTTTAKAKVETTEGSPSACSAGPHLDTPSMRSTNSRALHLDPFASSARSDDDSPPVSPTTVGPGQSTIDGPRSGSASGHSQVRPDSSSDPRPSKWWEPVTDGQSPTVFAFRQQTPPAGDFVLFGGSGDSFNIDPVGNFNPLFPPSPVRSGHETVQGSYSPLQPMIASGEPSRRESSFDASQTSRRSGRAQEGRFGSIAGIMSENPPASSVLDPDGDQPRFCESPAGGAPGATEQSVESSKETIQLPPSAIGYPSTEPQYGANSAQKSRPDNK